MTVLAPRENPGLIGHDEAVATLAAARAGGRMHHAWLIAGPPGVGKATLAFRFARALLAGGARPDLFVPPADPVFRRVAAEGHADLRTLERTASPTTKKTRSEIVVDDVRAATSFLRLTPAEGGHRVLIVDKADELNRNAANALLKPIEEPPTGAVILLLADAPGRLLPTIRSRCRRLALERLDDAAVDRVLAAAMPAMEAAERAALVAVAEGSPGRAVMLAEADGAKLAAAAARLLDALPEAGPREAFAATDAIGRTEGGFATFIDLLRAALARAVRDAVRGAAEGERLLRSRPAAAWGEAWLELGRIRDRAEGLSLDRRQAMLDTVAALTGR